MPRLGRRGQQDLEAVVAAAAVAGAGGPPAEGPMPPQIRESGHSVHLCGHAPGGRKQHESGTSVQGESDPPDPNRWETISVNEGMFLLCCEGYQDHGGRRRVRDALELGSNLFSLLRTYPFPHNSAPLRRARRGPESTASVTRLEWWSPPRGSRGPSTYWRCAQAITLLHIEMCPEMDAENAHSHAGLRLGKYVTLWAVGGSSEMRVVSFAGGVYPLSPGEFSTNCGHA